MACNGIHAKQQRAIAALISEPTIKGAAEVAGVGERTLHRWLLEDENFKDALAQAESALIDGASRQLLSGQTQALNVLSDIMQNSNDTNRRLAAVAWLELSIKVRDWKSIEERLTKLENMS